MVNKIMELLFSFCHLEIRLTIYIFTYSNDSNVLTMVAAEKKISFLACENKNVSLFSCENKYRNQND